MTPTECIAMLDSQLAEHGEEITLQRLILGPNNTQIPFSVVCRAFVRGYEPDQMIGGITQQHRRVILSPTQIIAKGWTGGRPATEDTRVPKEGNKVLIEGKVHNVEAAGPKYVGGELVRIELSVKG